MKMSCHEALYFSCNRAYQCIYENIGKKYQNKLKWIIRYLNGNVNKGIMLENQVFMFFLNWVS